MMDLRQNLTIDDYFSAWEYLASKADAQRKAVEEQKQAQAIAQLNRRGGMG